MEQPLCVGCALDTRKATSSAASSYCTGLSVNDLQKASTTSGGSFIKETICVGSKQCLGNEKTAAEPITKTSRMNSTNKR